jgi:uncharacterized SAM-binding protein YcdF (DUF218 family)
MRTIGRARTSSSSRSRSSVNKLSRRAKAGLCFAAIAFGAIAASCGVPGRELFLPQTALRHADAIVVLGNRPPRDARGNIAPEIGRRVERGVALFERGLAPRILFTGGRAPDGSIEADVMAARAIELGVDPDAIVRERRARDTAENARFAIELLCAGRRDCRAEIIVVSSPYHLRRAVELFECAGARVQWASSEMPDALGDRISAGAYEYGVRIAYVFDDACARATPRRR